MKVVEYQCRRPLPRGREEAVGELQVELQLLADSRAAQMPLRKELPQAGDACRGRRERQQRRCSVLLAHALDHAEPAAAQTGRPVRDQA